MSTEIRLYMFQTGILKCRENNIKMNASLDPYEIPVPWYLITHPKGNIIIDGGNAVECATDPEALGRYHLCLLAGYDGSRRLL